MVIPSTSKQMARESTADALEHFMEDDQEIPNETATDSQTRLAPIRFLINRAVTSKYLEHEALPTEIKRCFEKSNLIIKFAYIQDRKVTIVTDNKETHGLLSATWPNDAFTNGISPCISSKNKTFKITLSGVPISLDLSSVKNELELQGIKNSKRHMTRNGNISTSIINAEVTGLDKYKTLLAEGFTIGLWSKRYKVLPKFRTQQCFKCLEVGYLRFNCNKEKKCINCSQTHAGDCENESKCANCGGSHSAVSRKCNYLKQHEKTLKLSRSDSSTFTSSFKKAPQPKRNAWLTNSPNLNEQSSLEVSNQIDNKINTILNSYLEKIDSKINSLISNHLETIMTKAIEPITAKICETLLAQLSEPNLATHHLSQVNRSKSPLLAHGLFSKPNSNFFPTLGPISLNKRKSDPVDSSNFEKKQNKNE